MGLSPVLQSVFPSAVLLVVVVVVVDSRRRTDAGSGGRLALHFSGIALRTLAFLFKLMKY